jgi:RimJ/RimL family protein N-acetyltransferase
MVEWDGTVLLTTPRLLLRRFRPDDLPLYAALNADPEVAWRLAHEHWGHGYATEAATGWLDHAFGPLGLPRVISITDRPNLRSLAVMRRLGMEFDHEAEIEDMGQVFQAVVYSITAERWRSARQR